MREYVSRRPAHRPTDVDVGTLQGLLIDAAWKSMEFHDYSQVAVAEACDLSPKHLNQMLHGRAAGTFEAWDRLLYVLDIKIGWRVEVGPNLTMGQEQE